MGSPELPRGQLSVKVFEANGTRGSEAFGVGNADPYATLKLANLKARTKVHEDAGSYPVWNQTFTFNLPTSDRKYNELTISIFNDNNWRKDTLIGESRINVASLVAEKGNSVPPDWYEVNFEKKQHGWIYVAFDFTPTPDSSAPQKDNPKVTVADNSGTRIPEVPNKGPSTLGDEGVPKAKPKEPEEGKADSRKSTLNSSTPDGPPSTLGDEGVPKAKPKEPEEGKADSRKSTLNSTTPGGPPSNSPNEPEEEHRPESKSESRPPTEDDNPPDKAPSDSPEEDQDSPEDKFEAGPGSFTGDDSIPTENHQGPHSDGLPSKNEDNTPDDQVTPSDDQQASNPTEEGEQDGQSPGNEGGESGQKRPGTDDEFHDGHEDDINHESGEAVENGLAKLGGDLYNAAASMFEASKDLGRKIPFNYVAVPALVISLLVLAITRKKGGNAHAGENSDSRAVSFEDRTCQGSRGIPTSTRQKRLFYRIHGSP